jgi:chromosome segregation ATPase
LTLLLTQYNNKIDELKIELEERAAELENLNSLVTSYNKSESIYLGTTDSLTKIDGNSTETYDALVRRQKEISDEITDINADIRKYQIKIANLTDGKVELNSSASEEDGKKKSDNEQITEDIEVLSEEEIEKVTEETEKATKKQVAAVESEMTNLQEQIGAVWSDFSSMLTSFNDGEINEQTVEVTSLRYDAPKLISGSFIKKFIKVGGPFLALGFILCMAMLFNIVKREEKE